MNSPIKTAKEGTVAQTCRHGPAVALEPLSPGLVLLVPRHLLEVVLELLFEHSLLHWRTQTYFPFPAKRHEGRCGGQQSVSAFESSDGLKHELK